MSNSIAMSLKGVSKSFGPVRALDRVNLNIYEGKVMALLGENGAGKSTVIKCAAGMHRLDSGSINVFGKNVRFASIKDSVKASIAVVHQELKLVDDMTVAENIFLGRYKTKFSFINHPEMFRESKKYLDILNVSFSSRTLVKELTIAEQQMVEIAKALSLNAKIIILDEPTDALSQREVIALFSTIKSLKQKGISFLYVTHRMSEIFEICDNYTVFKDGKFIIESSVKGTSIDFIINKMIGRDLKDQFPKKDLIFNNEISYEFVSISNKYVKDISLNIKKGEVLGISGLVGSGRTEFARTIIGDLPKVTGKIYKNGKEIIIKNINKAIKNKIFYVTENRKFDGLNVDDTISNNMTSSFLNKLRTKFYTISYQKIRKEVKKQKENMNIKMFSQSDMVSSLSGGNQQKVLLGKGLMTVPELLILDEPTRGVDVGARKEIYSIIQKISKKGTSIIMISSDLPEVIGMSDRIAVFHEGKLSGILDDRKTFSENQIMKLATNQIKKEVKHEEKQD